ncbi:DUF503 domain-containing protein [Geomonas sp. RF6]|uniref:DUF503 domain-containing protein n=1 Tax=Geomonas sp. RF6 TaxID=2897342 RepID=UPI001E52E5A8|nr:DUF503 domain-containing protein [Geomonas sp. RF6]UFS68910.1 DUF503 domain-containing protein [Geomonas sp. RF6]
MHVLLLKMRLRLMSRTLKEKRSIVKSVLSRARNSFNVACAESELHDQPGDAELSFVALSFSVPDARRLLQQVEEWVVETRPDVEVTDVLVEEL